MPRQVIFLACALVAVALPACGGNSASTAADTEVAGDTPAADGASDTAAAKDDIVIPPLAADRSAYFFDVTRSSGEHFVIDRDVTEDGSLDFTFSNDGTAPTLALSFGDALVTVRLLVVDLDFGLVLAADGTPDTAGVGTYRFSDDPPSLALAVDSDDYDSRTPGATGAFTITAWS